MEMLYALRNWFAVNAAREMLKKCQVKQFSRMEKFCLIVFLGFLAGCGGKLLDGCNNGEAIEAAKNHFQPLIEAAEKHYSEKGSYPRDPIDLVPKYINKIPEIGAFFRPLAAQSKINKDSPHPNIWGSWIDMQTSSILIVTYIKQHDSCFRQKQIECGYSVNKNPEAGWKGEWDCKEF